MQFVEKSENPQQCFEQYVIPEMKDPVRVFGELMELAENRGIKVRLLPLKGYKSRLHKNRIGISYCLPFREVVFELAFELAHAHIHSNCGDTIKSPDHKDYNRRAEFAACMMIDLLNIKIAYGK